MRKKIVVAGIVRDHLNRFLITWNPKWDKGYSFPMNDVETRDDVTPAEAVKAVVDDLDIQLPGAKPTELEFMVDAGKSGSTDELTSYDFHLYEVKPKEAIDLSRAKLNLGKASMFLSYQELLSRTDLTWATPNLVREFVEYSELVLTVIHRPGLKETEVLLVWHEPFGGYFFPAQRCTSDIVIEAVARKTIRDDLNYRSGYAAISRVGETVITLYSKTFEMERNYTMHVCLASLFHDGRDDWKDRDDSPYPVPETEDLHVIFGHFEKGLIRRGKRFRWVPISQLRSSWVGAPEKMEPAAIYVSTMVPEMSLPDNLPVEKMAVALIQRETSAGVEFLGYWDNTGRMFKLIGEECGDRETLEECHSRMMNGFLDTGKSELPENIDGNDVYLEFVSRSLGDKQLRRYKVRVSRLGLSGDVKSQIRNANVKFRWLTKPEILADCTSDSGRICSHVGTILYELGLLTIDPEEGTQYS